MINNAKRAMVDNSGVVDDLELKKIIRKGRYWVRELETVAQIHKYRALKGNYDPQSEEKP